jgi:TonB family protein
MKEALITACVLVCLVTCAEASDKDLEVALRQKYVGKTLILRHPVQRSSQRYDGSGKLLSGGTEGPWTLFGGVVVDTLLLGPERLQLEGRRDRFIYDARNGALTSFPEKGPRLKLEVSLDHPCASVDEAMSILGRVFAITDEDLVSSVPVYWKPYVAKRGGLKWEEADLEVLALKQGEQLGLGIEAPKADYTPAPDYMEETFKWKFQGTIVLSAVIDASGKVQQLRIVQPLGMGLDDKGVETVKTWRFKPAKKDGQPVSVRMSLEIGFNLLRNE